MQDLSLNVMDIAQNSVTAGADYIRIKVLENDKVLEIVIEDNGHGMNEEQVSHVTDPFFTTRTTRKVGMGTSLFKMQAEMTGGRFEICSTEQTGTSVTACFHMDHLDMIPIGDMETTVSLLIACNPELDFYYKREIDGAAFELNTKELREVLGNDVPLNSPDVTAWIKDYLQENLNAIKEK